MRNTVTSSKSTDKGVSESMGIAVKSVITEVSTIRSRRLVISAPSWAAYFYARKGVTTTRGVSSEGSHLAQWQHADEESYIIGGWARKICGRGFLDVIELACERYYQGVLLCKCCKILDAAWSKREGPNELIYHNHCPHRKVFPGDEQPTSPMYEHPKARPAKGTVKKPSRRYKRTDMIAPEKRAGPVDATRAIMLTHELNNLHHTGSSRHSQVEPSAQAELFGAVYSLPQEAGSGVAFNKTRRYQEINHPLSGSAGSLVLTLFFFRCLRSSNGLRQHARVGDEHQLGLELHPELHRLETREKKSSA
ncbi:hypothetical protein BJV74DRAFT_796904 [Russula compacta]|nr:hypothetical protein BJV74DRAFT_796904 [Russula compacta]